MGYDPLIHYLSFKNTALEVIILEIGGSGTILSIRIIGVRKKILCLQWKVSGVRSQKRSHFVCVCFLPYLFLFMASDKSF